MADPIGVANVDAELENRTIVTRELDEPITGAKTFTRAPNPPFAIQAGSAKVDNLDADKLDGLSSSDFAALTAANTFTNTNLFLGALSERGTISPPQIVANTDNYAPASFATCSVMRLSTDAARNLTGIAGGADGRLIRVFNVGAFNLVLVHDATSTAANRFLCPGSANYTVTPNSAVILWYDATSQRWRVLGGVA